MRGIERASGGRGFTRSLILLLSFFATGCLETTWWDATGSWSGRITLPGTAAVQQTGSASDPSAGTSEQRIELCRSSVMVLGLPFVKIERDRPAAIEVRTARPLCQQGSNQINGGAVLIWGNPGSDPNVLAATRSDAWVVTGAIEVTSYLSQELPKLDPTETADTERVEGTFSLTATNGSSVIRIDGGTFHLTVVASRVKFSPA